MVGELVVESRLLSLDHDLRLDAGEPEPVGNDGG
jgi:hypothetical protein